MRIRELSLKAVGPFTDRRLVFDSPDPGLHIVYGPNEAGKSSALRALKALLYGFEEQTPDNFRHPYDQLLVGGTLQDEAGSEFTFMRRKRRKANLLGSDGDPIEPARLSEFLHGVEPPLFASLYGIDHDSLVRGGQDILAQQGEVGQALFSAGSGIASVQKVLDGLESEAADLFKPQGSKPLINQLLKEQEAHARTVREASLSASQWLEQRKTLERAEEERRRLDEKRQQLSHERRRLERLLQAIPELALQARLAEQLAGLGDPLELPLDFADQHRLVEEQLRATRLDHRQHSDRQHGLATKRQSIRINRPLLEQAELIDDLHQRLGEYRKGAKDLERLEGMRIHARKEAATLLAQVRPDVALDAIDQLRPLLGRRRTIRQLAARHGALTARLDQAERQLQLAAGELGAVETRLAGLPPDQPAEELLQAVQLARKAGDLDHELTAREAASLEQEQACIHTLSQLALWSGELDGLPRLALPLPATVVRFEDEYQQLAESRRLLASELDSNQRQQRQLLADRRQLGQGGRLPSESELAEARDIREHGWQLLRRQWLENAEIGEAARLYHPDLPLPAAYEQQVARADELADRLRREADRVAADAALVARLAELDDRLALLRRRQTEQEQQAEELAGRWRSCWAPTAITPLSPREMREWLARMEQLRFEVRELHKERRDLARLEEQRLELCGALHARLTGPASGMEPAAPPLAPLLLEAEHRLEAINRGRASRQQLEEQRQQATAKLERAAGERDQAGAAVTDWRRDWQGAVSGLGLDRDLLPDTALDLLEGLENSFKQLHDAEELRTRIDGIRRDARRLREDLHPLCRAVAPELAELPPEQAITRLQAMLAHERQQQAGLAAIAQEIEEHSAAIQLAATKLAGLESRQRELLRLAGCTTVPDLVVAIDRAGRQRRLREQLAEKEEQLTRLAAGLSMVELARQASDVEADSLPGRIEAISRELEVEIQPRLNELSERIGEAQKSLRAMDGGPAAAFAQEARERTLTRLRRLAERFLLLRTAGRLLRREIERYRTRHQDPILELASRHFRHLTIDSFAGLKADTDERGNAVLMGVRSDGLRVGVAGMSSGTRDQLYLALRLATLEWRLAEHEPLPFIVDDILINFDDQRSRATLELLADLAAKNQVILFTHHRQVAAEAQQLKGPGSVMVHNL